MRRDDIETHGVYKGFDLSGFEDEDLTVVVGKIEEIHAGMKRLRELCTKIVETGAVDDVGDHSLGGIKDDPPSVRVAKAKAFQISYERQFESEDSEPINPLEFETTEIYRIMQKLTGRANPVPSIWEFN
ncbi:MAG: hypothetical protein QXX77_08715 [Candidatus Methanosuratincola sp.]|jgi:hypothetical protein